jgi:hypothetical protein
MNTTRYTIRVKMETVDDIDDTKIMWVRSIYIDEDEGDIVVSLTPEVGNAKSWTRPRNSSMLQLIRTARLRIYDPAHKDAIREYIETRFDKKITIKFFQTETTTTTTIFGKETEFHTKTMFAMDCET